MWREWKTEWMKVRYRKIGLLLLAFLALTFLWIVWAIRDAHLEELLDGYRWVFVNVSMINTILLPTMTSMLASRLCDAELKGNTLKLLYTMERSGRLFDMKLLMGACYLFFYVAAELVLFFVFGKMYHFGQPLSLRHVLYFLVQNYLVTLAIYLLQQVLSFFFENQIVPLAAGLFGSFVGLFAWYLPRNPLGWFLPWNYYSLLGFVSYHWNEETRILHFYDVPFHTTAFGVLLMMLVLGYILGKGLFLKRSPGCT